MIEALEKGQAVDLSGLPPSPGQGEEHWLWWRLVECTSVQMHSVCSPKT